MRNVLVVFLVSTFTIPIMSQSYFTAGGVRLGTENGLTVKQRIMKHTTLEGIVLSGFKSSYLSAGVQIQRHYPLLFKNFNIYSGVGYQVRQSQLGDEVSEIYNGVSILGGIELTIGRLNVSWDYKPVIFFDAPRSFQSETGISLRYVFISNRDIRKISRKSKRKKKKRQRIRKRSK